MALRRAALVLNRILPAAGCERLPPAVQQQQQLSSLWSFAVRQSYAVSAAYAQQGPPAAGSHVAATGVAATSSAAAAATLPASSLALPDVYMRLDERVSGPYAVEAKRVFAVVEVGGTQYKVTPNDVIVVEKLADVDVNDKLQLQRVLLLGSQAETIIGRPYVPNAAITAAVEEQFLDGKVLIFHKRRRKNSRRLRGHRQPLTTLRILNIHGISEAGVGDVAESLS